MGVFFDSQCTFPVCNSIVVSSRQHSWADDTTTTRRVCSLYTAANAAGSLRQIYLTFRNCYKMRTAELQLFVKIYDNPQYLLQKHNLLAPASAASQHSIISDSVHSPHCRVQMFDPATSLTRVLLLDYFLRSECIIPRGWSDNGIESYNTCTIHVLVFLRCRKKSTEHNTFWCTRMFN